MPVGGHGWLAPGAEANAYAEGTETPPDLKESYSLGAETATGDPEVDRIWFAPNVWPAEVPLLQPLVTEYTAADATALPTICSRCSPTRWACPRTRSRRWPTQPTWTMNINHYPPVSVVGEPEPGQFRIGPHTDFGTVTILDREPGAGGLQVYSDADGLGRRAVRPGRADREHRRSARVLERAAVAVGPASGAAAATACARRGSGLAHLLLRGQPRRGGHAAGAADRAGVGAGAGHVVGLHQGAARRHHRWLSRASARMAAMRVYLGSDHAGFELKQAIIEHLQADRARADRLRGLHLRRRGRLPGVLHRGRARRPSPTRAASASCSAARATASRSPRTRCPGARCALAWSIETATLARQHNNAQVIGIGGRMHTVEQALEIVDAFLSAQWSKAERHQRRIDILAEYEKTHVAPPVPGARARCQKATRCTGWPGCTSAGSAARR